VEEASTPGLKNASKQYATAMVIQITPAPYIPQNIDILDTIEVTKEAKHLGSLQKYHSYLNSKSDLHMRDIYIDNYNPRVQNITPTYCD
jgi:hypothetical protein